jgi:signal transduction histidine kinase
VALHAVGYWAYSINVRAAADSTRDHALAERIVSIKRAVAAIADTSERDKTAHTLSSASLEVHWSRNSLVLANAPLTERAQQTADRLKSFVPDLAAESFRIGFADDGAFGSGDAEAYRHMLLVSVRLEDQSWVNFSTPRFGTVPRFDPQVMLLSACIALVILIIAALLLRWVTRPLRTLAVAAERFSLDAVPERLAETGPQEVRRAARAFNTMGDRILKLVGDRTQALAAVSHDLRTPITRVRLRSELLDDAETRALIDGDLAEMEQMIDGTLEFLKGGDSIEPRRLVDLASIARTIVDDMTDAGAQARLDGKPSLLVHGQPVALKRALGNLVANAVKHGGGAAVSLYVEGEWALVSVADGGPGIPPERLADVFDPFVRLETSRSKETGGVGLGLTIARGIARKHGGDVTLANRPEGGLLATLSLPVAPTSAATTASSRQGAPP